MYENSNFQQNKQCLFCLSAKPSWATPGYVPVAAIPKNLKWYKKLEQWQKNTLRTFNRASNFSEEDIDKFFGKSKNNELQYCICSEDKITLKEINFILFCPKKNKFICCQDCTKRNLGIGFKNNTKCPLCTTNPHAPLVIFFNE
jgi:hypothetical protein